MIRRRSFIEALVGGAAAMAIDVGNNCGRFAAAPVSPGGPLPKANPGEDIFAYVWRVKGSFNTGLYNQILGAANALKEGDQIVGVAAADEASRKNARTLLANTRLRRIDTHPLLRDQLFGLLEQSLDKEARAKTANLTMSELKQFLLRQNEDAIKAVTNGLSSDVIGCVVKLMTNEELIAVGAKVFNLLPGSRIGAIRCPANDWRPRRSKDSANCVDGTPAGTTCRSSFPTD